MKKVFGGIVAIVLIAVAGWGYFAAHYLGGLLGGGLEKAGVWGDTFGALNAFFGGLAFSGVIATLWMQRRELANQQNQLRDAQREQHLQRFDSTFFQLLTLLRDLREEVRTRRHEYETELKGPAAFREFYDINLKRSSIDSDKPMSKEDISALYASSTLMHAENPLGPFFRIVYSILRRISEDAALTTKDKERYGNLVRSHLSTAEVGLVGLNGLVKESNDFSKFIEEFRMLKYLPENRLKSDLRRFYSNATFDARD